MMFAQLLPPYKVRKLSVTACKKSVFGSAAITQVEEEIMILVHAFHG